MAIKYTIGEAAKTAGVTTRAIRLYETKGLFATPERTAAHYRLFTDNDVARLTFIRRARQLGLSLNAIAEIIAAADQGASPCERTCSLLAQRIAEIDALMADLTRLRATIAAAQGADVTDTSATYCAVIEGVADSN